MFGLFRKKKPPVDLGQPIVVVSGLPRSGTSMAMKMLEKAGITPVQDGVREADEDNPKGYYEDERVKDLANSLDKSWLKDSRGKVVKVISFLLKELPKANQYKVIFMRRNLDEVLASQAKMLVNRAEPNPTADEAMRKMYVEHLEQVHQLVASHPTMDMVEIHYKEMVEDPATQARKIAEFLGRDLDVEAMATVADRKLYRNRASS